MNVALPAVLLFLVVLPGFIARARYKRVEQVSLDYSPFGEAAASAVVCAGLLHAAWLTIAYFGWDRVLDLQVLIGLLSPSPALQELAARRVAADQAAVIAYFSSILLLPYFLAPAFRALIARLHLDRGRLAPLFKFHRAPWYYLFTAADAAQPPDLVMVAAIVDIGKQPYLYQGVLSEYFLAPDGSLDRMVLRNVQRRRLEQDKPAGPGLAGRPGAPDGDTPAQPEGNAASGERFYSIDGTYFVLRYAEVVTLNVWHVVLEDA